MKVLMACLLYFTQNFGSYNSVVQIIDGDSTYTGVNISNGIVLTTANSGATDSVSIIFHGENGKKFKTKGIVQKIDYNRNLCLLTYSVPQNISGDISVCKIRDKFFTKVDIIGWGAQNAHFSFVNQPVKNVIHIGDYNYNFSGLALINEGSLVGLQTYKAGPNIYWINASVINDFLEENK